MLIYFHMSNGHLRPNWSQVTRLRQFQSYFSQRAERALCLQATANFARCLQDAVIALKFYQNVLQLKHFHISDNAL